MVEKYVNHAVFHINGFSGARYRKPSPAPCIPCLLGDLYRIHRVNGILIIMCCSSWHVDASFQQCALLACGKLSLLSEGRFQKMFILLEVPPSLTINVTIFEVSSEWDDNDCMFTASLRLLTNGLTFPAYYPYSIPICGKSVRSPRQTFYFANHRLSVLWKSPESHLQSHQALFFLTTYTTTTQHPPTCAFLGYASALAMHLCPNQGCFT